MEQLIRNSHLTDKGYSTAEDNLSKPRHRWYYFKEGFSHELVAHAINSIGLKKNDLVFDPFMGSGTVNLYSSQNKINSVGVEVNPFAFFLSKTKQVNASSLYLKKNIEKDLAVILNGLEKGQESSLESFSTFSELTGKEKWLFNSEVLRSFQGGSNVLNRINYNYRNLFRLALINAIMDNCNAKKDGKCLRYKTNWNKLNYSRSSFINSFEEHIQNTIEDLRNDHLYQTATLFKSDARSFLQQNSIKFKLCITSPPYLNSFDYTDIYRPELYLGGFVRNATGLKELRKQTICSHINIYPKFNPTKANSILYTKVLAELQQHTEELWSCHLLDMVRLYFTQMENILKQLYKMGQNNSELWIIVANSAYYNSEIPTDLILADLGCGVGWKLKEIIILREVFKRGSRYSPDIKSLREGAIVFSKSKGK